MKHILLVDDDAELLNSLSRYLKAKGYETRAAAAAREAHKILERQNIDLVLLDLTLQGLSGLDLLKKIRQAEPAAAVIVLTGNVDIATAVAAIKAGAHDYITKPFGHEQLLLAIEKALGGRELAKQVTGLKQQLKAAEAEPSFLGKSRAAKTLLNQVKTVAPTDLAVIIEGESGTGKELLARLVHLLSLRHEGPFLAIDGGALPENLVESELFGYERGAFTGAEKSKHGLFETAYRGTLFLDEIGNLSLGIQSKLLRVLETRTVRHLGGKKDIPVDVRLVAASNRPLAQAMAQGAFRSDLFYRLNQFTLNVPSLRERPEDINLLTLHFLKTANKELKKSVAEISPEAINLLRRYPWPGNVRELKHVITRACLLSANQISPEHLPEEITKGAPSPAPKGHNGAGALKKSREEAEKKLIAAALRKTGGNK
ncbi:MAG: sigma-54 dependent transcriptional regulator, partial [Elusimicrobiota bacterium]